MPYQTLNPATDELVEEYPYLEQPQIDAALDRAVATHKDWRKVPFARRAEGLMKVADALEKRAEEFARTMALEMGKPVTEGKGEAQKCAWVCRFYAENAEEMLKSVSAESDASESFVRYDPLGPILAIMPWNYPFWQVFRFAAPGLMAGNVALLKHASNVPRCAMQIEELFRDAGFPEHAFQSIFVSGSQASAIIGDKRIKGVTLTGSTEAGRKVGEAAGRAIKPCVLELGGSDPFIVLDDADVKTAAKVGVASRCLNSGQSCISAKRFIVTKAVLDEFTEIFTNIMKGRVMGDPMSDETDVGPQARPDLRDELAEQVQRSIDAGAKAACGGCVPERKGAFYPPTVLTDVRPGMAAADEELFGPAAAIIAVKNEAEAIEVANRTDFGLGASLWTEDADRAKRLIPEIEAGAVFVNGLVKSDPRLPFGGIKESGFGRELSREGILEFVNQKTVWIR
ncbi:NAD-dependent succinate-semialdehyde dehydrogenase [bacterium]|nr:NAD-dependent succinate-semialdehyde dehydrogenase [bacterium]